MWQHNMRYVARRKTAYYVPCIDINILYYKDVWKIFLKTVSWHNIINVTRGFQEEKKISFVVDIKEQKGDRRNFKEFNWEISYCRITYCSVK